MASTAKNLINEGDHVLFKKTNNIRMFQVHRTRDVWLEKAKFCLDGIIGQPYGTSFEVKDGKMVKMEKTSKQDADSTGKGLDTDKDNRHLQDSDSNQKLTAEEIEQLKKEGVTGDKLIEQLIENSTTYQNKTEYAQEKWVKKKKNKHLLEFTILKPTSRLLCEMYRSKGPARICNLRIDSLAQILTLGNVNAHSTVAVVDTCLGLITGAVMERLRGFGKVISLYHGDNPMRSPLDAYDFPKEVKDTLYYFPLDQVNSLKTASESKNNTYTNSCTNNQSKDPGTEDVVIKENVTLSTNEDSANKCENTDTVENKTAPEVESSCKTTGTENSDKAIEDQKKGNWKKRGKKKRPNFEERAAAKEARAKEIQEARNIILQKNIDCLIVACKFHPTPIVTALLDYVAPSRQIVVFGQFKEALEDCYVHLREHKGLVSYRMTETWLREYQVLPNRTHPVIQMSGTGGYLLTATTIVQPST